MGTQDPMALIKYSKEDNFMPINQIAGNRKATQLWLGSD